MKFWISRGRGSPNGRARAKAKKHPKERVEIANRDNQKKQPTDLAKLGSRGSLGDRNAASMHEKKACKQDIISTFQPTNPWTKAEPQQIVAQRLLSCLQYLVQFRSYTKDLTRPELCIVVKYSVDRSYCYTNEGQGEYRRISQHGFWFRGVQS